METLTNLFSTYFTIGNLIFAVILIATLYGLYSIGWVSKSNIYKWIEEYILLAEQKLHSEIGLEKLRDVINQVYDCIPPLARIIFTKTKIEAMILEAFDWLKETVIDEAGTEHTIPSVANTKYI